jgi:hypothetical protein
MADLPTPAEVSTVDSTDWPQQVAGMIVDGVGVVRDKTTVPVQTAARWAVYGLAAAMLGVVVLFLLLLISMRLGTEILQKVTGEDDIVWLTYTILGAVFVAFGLYCWSKRNPT